MSYYYLFGFFSFMFGYSVAHLGIRKERKRLINRTKELESLVEYYEERAH